MRLSIRAKMILLIGLPVAVIFAAVVLWILDFGTRQSRQLMASEMSERVSSAAAQFDEYIGRASLYADRTASFLKFLPDLNDEKIYELLSATVAQDRRIYGAAMAFEPGLYKEDGVLFSPYVYEDRKAGELVRMNIDDTVYDWYSDPRWEWWHLPKERREGVWTAPYFDEGAGNVLMTTYSVPFSLRGEFGGVTTVDIDLERLGEDVRESIQTVGDFYIFASSGEIVYSPDKSEILSRRIQDFPAEGSEDARAVVATILAGESGEAVIEGFLQEEKTIYAFAPISSTGWTFVGYMEEAVAMADFRKRRSIVLGVFGLSICVVLGMVVLMATKVAKPIGRLEELVQEIAKGKRDADFSEIRTGDEIESLGRSFGLMRDQVCEHERSLENARETTLSELLESAPDAMIVADGEGHIRRINSRVANLFGYSPEELQGRSVADLMPKRFRKGHGKHLAAYFKNPRARQMGAGMELEGVRSDGSEFPIEIGLSPFHEPEGLMAVAAIRDITERKKREEELRKLNLAVEQSSAAVFITNLEGDIEYVNERFVEVTGYSREEALGQNPRILKSGYHDPDFYSHMWETLSRGEVWQGEFQNRRKDGSLFWASAALSPIRDAEENTTHFVAIEDDITEQKEAADEIRAKEKRFRTLLANLPGTVYRCRNDEDWTMSFLSDQVEDLTGYPASDFLNSRVRTYDSVIHPEDRERVAREIGEAVVEENPWVIQYRIIHRDGSERWVGERGRAIRRETGEVDFLDGVIIDLTKEKEMEMQLHLAREQADAANRAKSDFLSSMSHELRTPLNGVLGYAQILQRDRSLTGKQRENLTSIINCGDHLLSLINDVLDLSKIEAGRMELDEAPCDLEKLIRSISDIVSERARSKGLDFITNVSPEVPRGILVDAPKLRQILVNLLGNAVKFTKEGAVTLNVRDSRSGELLFDVIDTGIGMSPDEAAVIFDPFKQVEAGKAAGGTGLGLAICTKLADKMGGAVEVESELGKGSVFRVRIPLHEIEEEAMTAVREEEVGEIGGRIAPGQEARILAADDREANRSILKQLLEEVGFEVDLADDGDSALERLGERSYDLVLMDVRMPRMNGIDAVSRIRKDAKLRELPIVAVTASVFPEFREKAIESGFSDFLAKPFRAEELLQVIQRHLDLEWVSEEVEEERMDASESGRDQRVSDSIGEEVITRFADALKIRNLSALNTLASELREDPATAGFGERMTKLTRAFDFDGLGHLLAESRGEGPG